MKFIKRKNIDTYSPKSQRLTVEIDGRAIINTDKSLTVPIGDTSARPATGVPGMVRYNNTSGYNDFEVFTGYGTWGWEKVRTSRPADITFQQVGTGTGDGTIDSIQIINPGSGYGSAPNIVIGPPDVGADQATATVAVSGGEIISFAWVNQGSGYLSVPTITIDGVNQTANLEALLTGELSYQLPIIPVDSMGVLSAKNVQIYVENVFQLPGINYTVTQGGGHSYVVFDAPVPSGKPIYAFFGFDR